MGQLGDGRAIELARAAIGEKDARLRAAAAEVFVLLDAGERNRAVEALIKDEVTAPAGVRLAERAQDEGVVNELAARAVATADHGLRQAIVRALGRGMPPKAVAVLQALAERDPTLETDIAQAIARSPSAVAMGALEKIASNQAKRRLALRAYFVRRSIRGERSDLLDRMLDDASRSRDAKDRTVAIPALVALGKWDLSSALDDPEPTVRRAAALAGLSVDPDRTERILLERLVKEKDPTTRIVYSCALRGGDPNGVVTTNDLIDRAQSGQADAALAALALARRVNDGPGGDQLEKKVNVLLASPVPAMRAHAALGLAKSTLPSATGKLADLYSFDVDPEVRRAAILSLSMRAWETAPIARRALEVAAKLDPDDDTRSAASRVLGGLKPSSPSLVREVAWLHAGTADGGPPPKNLMGTLVPKHGLAIPFAFDDEGFALVPGIPIGEAVVVLAPRVPGSKL
jgi:HEAT repeat protein